MSLLDDILRNIAEPERDRLVELLKSGPAALESLTGRRPHRSKLHRMYDPGVAGVRLRTVHDGRRRYTSLRWLGMFLVEVDAARRARRAEKKKAARPKRRAARHPTPAKRGITRES